MLLSFIMVQPAAKWKDKDEPLELGDEGCCYLFLFHLMQLELTASPSHITVAIRLRTSLPTLPKYGTRYSQPERAVRMDLKINAANANYFRCHPTHRFQQ